MEKMTVTEPDIKASASSRGKRVESLRRMTRLSRRLFAERYAIPARTLQNWEDATNSGLTEKGARRLINALKARGIHCSLEWLMYGIGSTPTISEHLYLDTIPSFQEVSESETDNELMFISEELRLFRHHYSNRVIDMVVTDDGMAPQFIVGDYVAGIKQHAHGIEISIGHPCIVQTKAGDILLRHLRTDTSQGTYTLTCLNPHTTVSKPILYDTKIISIAPVIWHRRKYSKIK